MTTQSETDWARVKQEAGADATISVDMASEPYDPNDEGAVFAHWEGATIRQNGLATGLVRKPGTQGEKQ